MKKIITVILFSVSLNAYAGECKVTVDREVCPGVKKEEALKPYDMKNPTTDVFKESDAAACEKKAEKLAKILRKGTIASKKATATFDGKDIKGASDKADCK